MSADFRTEHFKGWQHDGYVHVARVDGDGQEYPLGDLTAGEVAELASMFEPADTVTIPRSDLTALLAGAAALGKYPADVPGLLKPLVEDVLKRYKVRLEMTL
jgi:hypothetical protein